MWQSRSGCITRGFGGLALLLVAGIVLAAPPPKPKPRKAADGPFEIDFTPLDGTPAGQSPWELHLEIVSDRGKVKPVVTGVEKPEIKPIILLLATGSFKGLEWTVDKSGKKLIVQTLHGKRPLSVKVSVKGLGTSFTPKVRQLAK